MIAALVKSGIMTTPTPRPSSKAKAFIKTPFDRGLYCIPLKKKNLESVRRRWTQRRGSLDSTVISKANKVDLDTFTQEDLFESRLEVLPFHF